MTHQDGNSKMGVSFRSLPRGFNLSLPLMKLLNIAQEIIQLLNYLGMIYMVVFKDTAKCKTSYLNVSGVIYRTEQANQPGLLSKRETAKRLSSRPYVTTSNPSKAGQQGITFPTSLHSLSHILVKILSTL